MITVVIAEGEWQYRDALEAHLRRSPEFDVLAATADAERALAEIDGDVGVAFVDLDLSGEPGCALVEALRERSPSLPIIAFTRSTKPDLFRQALASGVHGYLLKREADSPDRVVEAIRTVAGGGTYFGELASGLLESLARDPASAGRPFGLTAREVEVLAPLGDGLSNKEIAEQLSITEQAVKNHLRRIYPKLGVTNRTAAALIAHRAGLGKPDRAP